MSGIPNGLQVVQACIRVASRVDALRAAPAGDTVMHRHLNPPYQGLLMPGNSEGVSPCDWD